MLLVIFGAGASYDSVDPIIERRPFDTCKESQPPLANGLFARAEFPGSVIDGLPFLAGVSPSLRRFAGQSEESIETELNTLVDEQEGNPSRRKELMAIRFYLQRVIMKCSEDWGRAAWGITNYNVLLRQTEAWRCRRQEPVALVTFNYDTLIEQAMRGQGLAPFVNEGNYVDYIGRNDYRLYKVHGSVNWSHCAVLAPGTPQSDDSAVTIVHNVDTVAISEVFSQKAPHRDELSVPALAVPVRQDKEFECPPEHIAKLKEDLKDVDRLLVIGWAGKEPHFIRLLQGTKCNPMQTLVVSGSESEGYRTVGELNRAGINRNVRINGAGFSELLRPAGLSGLNWLLQP